MLSDIKIAQQAEMKPIYEVASEIGIDEKFVEPYGKYKCKLDSSLYESLKDKKDGKLILVTAINPTPAGEGKTTTSVGIGEAMKALGKKAVVALREPSLGLFSELRAEPQAEDMLRLSRWRTLISTSQEICTLSQRLTICCRQSSTIIFNRATSSILTKEESFSNAVWI